MTHHTTTAVTLPAGFSPSNVDRRKLLAFGAIVFGSLLPSRGTGVSWDELAELVVVVVGSAIVIGKHPAIFRQPYVVFGVASILGATGMLIHEDAYLVVVRCAYIGLFILGIVTAATVPTRQRSATLLMLGLGSLIGQTIAAYSDLRGWNPSAIGGRTEAWHEGMRGMMSSHSSYATLTVPLLLAYARQRRFGPLAVAAFLVPYTLAITAGIGVGRGQSVQVLLGALIVLAVDKGVVLVAVAAVAMLAIEIGNWTFEIPSLFSAFLDRISQTQLSNIDRIEHARLSFKLLSDATFTEVISGIPLSKIESLVSGGGIHNGYLEPLAVGGWLAALPLWLLFGYLFSLTISKKWKEQDSAGIASLAAIVQLAFNLFATPIFWEWHGALYLGLSCGFACYRKSIHSECIA